MQKFIQPWIVDLNEDDFDRCSQSSEICLEKLLLCLTIFFGVTSVDLTETEQLIGHSCTYWSTENPHAKFSVTNTDERMMMWCGLS